MIDVDDLLKTLASVRPVFHSEADFQHSFAWELHLRYPTAEVRLERVLASTLGSLHVDVFCLIAERSYVFELKYKTCAVTITIGTETFSLQDHGVQPLGRYDVLRDLVRVEAIVSESHASCGYVIFLTNDSAYWCEPRSDAGTSDAFSLCDGRTIYGELNWSATAASGTKLKREQAIKLAAQYALYWQHYSKVAVRSYPHFRYLTLNVRPPAVSP